MPTLYTAFIEDRTITNGADFLKLCTRNFQDGRNSINFATCSE